MGTAPFPVPSPSHPSHSPWGLPSSAWMGGNLKHPPPHDGGDNLFSQLRAQMPLALKELIPVFPLGHQWSNQEALRVQAKLYLFDANVSVRICFNSVLFYVSLQSRPFSPPIHSSSPPPIAPLARAESTSSISSTNSLSAATTPTVGKHTQHCCSFTFPTSSSNSRGLFTR